jgi:hypothetical protein
MSWSSSLATPPTLSTTVLIGNNSKCVLYKKRVHEAAKLSSLILLLKGKHEKKILSLISVLAVQNNFILVSVKCNKHLY